MRNGIAALPAGGKGVRGVVVPNTAAIAIVVGPMPKRAEMRVAVNAAISEPTLPSEMTRPITPGESPSVRTRKTTMIANATFEKKFEVDVHPAWARRFGFERTKARPSFRSVHRVERSPSTDVDRFRGS